MATPVFNAMTRSRLVQNWIRSFQDFSGITMNLFAVNDGRQKEPAGFNEHLNPFCQLCIANSEIQKICLRSRELVCDKVCRSGKPESTVCFAGLWDSAIPILVGTEPVATLFLSGFSTEKLLKPAFERTAEYLQDAGIKIRRSTFEPAYLATRQLTLPQARAMLSMLTVSSRNLAEFANRRLIRAIDYEKPSVLHAKQYIQEHSRSRLTMDAVARHVGLSLTYFSKTFKKETGLSFPEYVNRVRLDDVKGFLIARQKTINESAFAAGFESISHFNRVFKKFEGISPIRYRDEMQAALVPEENTPH